MDLKSIIHTVTDKIVDAVQHLQGNNEKIPLTKLASYIKEDPNTVKTSHHLLGIDLHEYHVEANDLQFILETKGKSSEKTLALTVLKEGTPLFKYRSYEPNYTPDMTIALPGLKQIYQ